MRPMDRLKAVLSMPGLIVGAWFFALSLTPSLIPRPPVIQGLLSGCVFAVGYAIGATLFWFWTYLELRLPDNWLRTWLWTSVATATTVAVIICLYYYPGWQNAVRAAMGIEPLEEDQMLVVIALALVPALVLVAIGTVLTHAVRRVAALLRRAMPPRAAFLAGIVIVGVITVFLVDGLLLRSALRFADEAFERLDAVAGAFGDPAPTDPLRSGSGQSLIAWGSIGRDGRNYVETQPSSADIAAVTGSPALEPLRTYVGLRSAGNIRDRAALALAEMQRIGAFDRKAVVIIMPVGTGWIDPPSIASLEYLLNGDIASVALQYSYLSSPLSLVVEPEQGIDAAQALFDTVYGFWRTLPVAQRPKLYLNGLSQGANSSQASTMFLDVLSAPFSGALWVGPPYTSSVWRWATANRVAGSPEWRPVVSDSSVIRFANRGAELARPGRDWGPIRIAFLQYPSDPIVFFDYSAVFTPPAWMGTPRGEGVTPDFQWYPVITFLQLGMDMALANTSPVGYGHVYSAADYTDAWYALVEPPGWDPAKLAALKAALTGNMGRS